MMTLSTRDWTQRDMLRATAALIKGRWPQYGDLAQRLEALALDIETATADICGEQPCPQDASSAPKKNRS